MKKLINYTALLCLFTLLYSCKEDEFIVAIGGGSPTIEVKTAPTASFMGDSLQFTVNVKDQGVALSTLKAQLLFSGEVVAEKIIRTKDYADYSGKLFVPFLKNIPNGTAALKFTLENVELVKKELEQEVAITRPDFPFINLVTATKTYKMNRVALNKYELTENLPFKVSGYLEAPKFGANGNVINFGWESESVTQGITQNIPFSNSVSGVYTISFNTLTYEAAPFIIGYAFNGEGMKQINDNLYSVDLQIEKDKEIVIDGIEDLATWTVDGDFVRKDGSKFSFNALTGKYRFYANFEKKHIYAEAMSGNNLATLNADGTGAIWIIGEGIGKPDVASSQVGWSPENAICVAPIGGKKYRVTVVAGKSIKADNINFKFFHQKNWGGEIKDDLTTTSDVVFVGNGKNGRDPGNLGLVTGKTLEQGATYEFIVDLSAGNTKGVLTVTKK